MDRSSKAALSPQELAALRRLSGDPRHSTASGHRQLFLSMHLVTADALTLTDTGRDRLAMEDRDDVRRAND